MLKPETAPLKCFALSWKKDDAMCQKCPHSARCRDFMGSRAERVALTEAKFTLVPEGFNAGRKWEEPDPERRDLQATYVECYRQVYGSQGTPGNVGGFTERIMKGAAAAKMNAATFILINMFAYTRTNPEKPFTPGLLADGRAVYRASTYANACRESFGAVNSQLLDVAFNSDLADYDLGKRMLDTEVKAAKWLINYKLWHQGLPYEPLFNAIEEMLDPAWLAVEPHYEPVLAAYSVRSKQPASKDRLEVRHEALEIYTRLKKHRHDAIAYFSARERIMPQAVLTVTASFGYGAEDFEIPNKPISDPLLFWNRLAIAVQHLECLLLVNYQEGIYAEA